jgi:light-regulated signal transduction histidine kinase (bacteriophytochrome)
MDDALWANRSYFESVIYNLITNGIKCSDTNKNSQIIIQSVYSRDTKKILITDDGICIDTTKYMN